MFSREMNKAFPDRRLFLFDTFEGFNVKDVENDKKNNFSSSDVGRYNDTNEKMVLDKMPFPKNVIIRKGFFPDTFCGLEREQFLFVNLDFDLYSPIYSGLELFYPRLADGGVILIHDYYSNIYHGVKEAINCYEKNNAIKLRKVPIGDNISIAVIK